MAALIAGRPQEPKREPRCEACLRRRWGGPQMHEAEIADVGKTWLCVNVAECKRHWN